MSEYWPEIVVYLLGIPIGWFVVLPYLSAKKRIQDLYISDIAMIVPFWPIIICIIFIYNAFRFPILFGIKLFNKSKSYFELPPKVKVVKL